nr:alpha/beta hydrolase-fold protein [Chromobacterium sp. ASV5]
MLRPLFVACALALPVFPAQALTPGQSVAGFLPADAARDHPLSLSPGDYVSGRFQAAGARLLLLGGGEARELAAPQDGEQDFQFIAGPGRAFVLQVKASRDGDYRLAMDKRLPPAEQRRPARPDSPRLARLARELAQGGDSAAFWREAAARGGPWIEDDPAKPGHALVTFLWRGARANVRIHGGPSQNQDEMARLGDSDVWYRTYSVPRDARFSYRLAPDVPQLDGNFMTRRRAILATAQRDPLNPRSFPEGAADRFAASSTLELRLARPTPWLAVDPATPRGEVVERELASSVLGNRRKLWLYRPAGYRPGHADNALLLVFDGQAYRREVPTPRILDNLIAAGRIPPTAAILIDNPDAAARGRELPPNPAFADFLARELLPWASRQGLAAPAARTVIAGSSYGGLAAAYAALRHPESFGLVYAQSGSFWWSPGGPEGGAEPGWLTREYVRADRLPLRFYLEAGRYENNGMTDIFGETRRFRDVLLAKGYPVAHREHASAHDYFHWRASFADGLIDLLGPLAPVR